jgi:sensor c-di-GMP phosphodiesterase-like protein
MEKNVQKNSLLTAWMFVIFFWWVVAIICHGYDNITAIADQSLEEIKDVFAAPNGTVPNGTAPTNSTEPNGTTESNTLVKWQCFLTEQFQIISKHWTLYALTIIGGSIMIGSLLSFFVSWYASYRQELRIKPSKVWRGIRTSKGDLHLPAWIQELPKFNSNRLNFASLMSDQIEAERLQLC